MRGVRAPITWGWLGLSCLILVAALIGFLSLANTQQELGFADSARSLRILVSVEAVAVLLAIVVALRATGWPNRIPILATGISLIAAADVILIAQAGVIPR